MPTERDLQILLALARYHLLNRQQIQRLVFPEDPNGRIARRRLQSLCELELIHRHPLKFCHPTLNPAPVYYLTPQGCEALYTLTDDESLLASCTQRPISGHEFHALAVSDTHIILDEAVAQQSRVKIESWINEWEVINKQEKAPEKKYRLYTLIRENPRLACVPDSAFLLSADGHSKIFYLEQDRATSGVQQIAASKTPGYAALAEQKLHTQHFTATVPNFTVLMLTPSEKRRDNLRKAIAQKPGAHLWWFAFTGDLTREKALHAPIWYACGKDTPGPLVKEKTA